MGTNFQKYRMDLYPYSTHSIRKHIQQWSSFSINCKCQLGQATMYNISILLMSRIIYVSESGLYKFWVNDAFLAVRYKPDEKPLPMDKKATVLSLSLIGDF